MKFIFVYQMGILLASLPALAGVIRLARFNVKLTSFEDKKYFIGLPIPSGALTILSYIIFFHIDNFLSEDIKLISIFVITFITSLAMVSNIKFDNLPRYSRRYIKNNKLKFIFFNIAVIAIIISKGFLILPLMIIYILGTSIRHFVIWIRTKYEIDDDFDDSEQEEPSRYD